MVSIKYNKEKEIKMKATKENIGPDHPLFNKNFPKWTQVIVRVENEDGWHIVAQFYGPFAKTEALKFIECTKR